MPLNVFAIGSCRIHRPLRHLDDAGEIKLLNRIDPCWFVHTSGASRQYLDVVSGRVEMPASVRPYVLETHPIDRTINFDGSEQLRSCDLIVVEVSSLKVNRANGWDLNAHILWKAQKHHDPAEVLRGVSERHADRGEVIGDLLYIRQSTGKPVITVDHLHFLDKAGNLISSRKAITDILSYAEAQFDFPFHSTRHAIEAHGIDVALEDSSHYRTSFESTAAAALLPSLQAALRTAPKTMVC